MPRKAEDLSGLKFGRLSVLHRVETIGRDVAWLCQCDCGNQKIIYGSSLRSGDTKSCGCLRRYVASIRMTGINNHGWRGDKVTYGALHDWIKQYKPKPERCELCHKEKPLECANISGTYKRDVKDFMWLCTKCHMITDGRLEKSSIRMKKIHREKKLRILGWVAV